MALPVPPLSLNEDAGLDVAPRNIEQTQSTPPSNSGYITDPNFLDTNFDIVSGQQGIAEPASEPGFGAPSDDGTTEGILAAGAVPPGSSAISSGGLIQARPNVLNQYASYTYSLSWYLLTPDQFNSLTSNAPNVNDWLLLIQSGGIASNQNRSQYFPIDYYLDNLQLQSMLPVGDQGTAAAHNVTSLEFTVTEPNGVTLVNALSDAVKDLYSQSQETNQGNNYALAIHCMVIHFYGYDENGNPINTGAFGQQNATPQSGGTPKPVIEKIYPFVVQKFDFRLSTRAVEYSIKGMVPQYQLHASAKRGSIPANFELVGRTVGDILSGNGSTGTRVQLDDGRKTTPTVQAPPPSPASDLTPSAVITGSVNEEVPGGGTINSLGAGA